MSDNTVPFGKYRGRPVEDMLADISYMSWLEAQPWFRDRYTHLIRQRDQDAESRTPVHNRLQALFLDEPYCRAFLAVACPDHASVIADFKRARDLAAAASAVRLDTLDRDVREAQVWIDKYVEKGRPGLHFLHETDLERATDKRQEFFTNLSKHMASDHVMSNSIKSTFEYRGADVFINWNISFSHFSCGDELDGFEFPRDKVFTFSRSGWCSIEIKPTVADEYPAVLRQMQRHESKYLFVDRYIGEGVTESQFVKIFAASDKIVVFKRDVDAALNK
jgi:hypothetical protein